MDNNKKLPSFPDFPKLDSEGFTEEQVMKIEKYGHDIIYFIAETIDLWMYSEVLPKTINPDDEQYSNFGVIKKSKLTSK